MVLSGLADKIVTAVVPHSEPCLVKHDPANGDTLVVYVRENLLVKLVIDAESVVHFSCAGMVLDEAAVLVNDAYQLIINTEIKDYPVDGTTHPEVFAGACKSLRAALEEVTA